MCLALYKPAKATLSKTEMATAFKANPDGAGFAYYDPALRQVVIQRGYFTFDSLWADLEPIMQDKCPLILHFRWATHGEVNIDNCHPFQLSDGALIHNGIISGLGNKYTYTSANKYYTPPTTGVCDDGGYCDDDRSDTREFVEDYLSGMHVNALRSAKKLIEFSIGYSKLATIHNDGSVIIFNESMGHWRNGVWYSNHSYVASKASAANPTNLVPTKGYDYHGKTEATEPTETQSASEFWAQYYGLDEDDVALEIEDETKCPRCRNEDGHDVHFDAVEDMFMLECKRCNEAWLVEGDSLSVEDYNKLYATAMNNTVYKLPY